VEDLPTELGAVPLLELDVLGDGKVQQPIAFAPKFAGIHVAKCTLRRGSQRRTTGNVAADLGELRISVVSVSRCVRNERVVCDIPLVIVGETVLRRACQTSSGQVRVKGGCTGGSAAS